MNLDRLLLILIVQGRVLHQKLSGQHLIFERVEVMTTEAKRLLKEGRGKDLREAIRKKP